MIAGAWVSEAGRAAAAEWSAGERPRSAVILAAGAGSRLRGALSGAPKPLTPLLGRTLLERAVRNGIAAGVERFIVVIGHRGDLLLPALRRLERELGVSVSAAANPDWERGNGSSVLAARRFVDGPFFLSMCDHVFTPELLRRLIEADDGRRALALAVDGQWHEVPDLWEATRVRRQGDQIRAIGKGLSPFDSVDTGVFLCRPPLFDALDVAGARGEHGLSDGVRILAARGRAFAVPVDGLFWQDIDTPQDLELARLRLLRTARISASTTRAGEMTGPPVSNATEQIELAPGD